MCAGKSKWASRWRIEHDLELTDAKCVYALRLDRAKIAVEHRFGFGLNNSITVDPELQGIVDWCVQVAGAA